jgi:hypothetical protein
MLEKIVVATLATLIASAVIAVGKTIFSSDSKSSHSAADGQPFTSGGCLSHAVASLIVAILVVGVLVGLFTALGPNPNGSPMPSAGLYVGIGLCVWLVLLLLWIGNVK